MAYNTIHRSSYKATMPLGSLAMDPLMSAIKSGSLSTVKKSIKFNPVVFDSRHIDYLALNYSIANEHEDIALFFIDQDFRVKNTNSKVYPHQTPLHSAVKRRCSINLITKLLQEGASIVALDQQGYSPLHLALIHKNDAAIDAILNLIVRTKNYENVKSKEGLNHFHVACTRKNAEVIEGFITFGIDIEAAVSNDSEFWPGYTAQHFAAEFRSLDAVRILKKKIGRSSVKDKNGQTPEDLARKSLDELSVMMYLLADDASQFHAACSKDNPKLVKKFLENGASVSDNVPENVTLSTGYSPLHFAVESNCKENVEILLKEKADIEHQDACSRTPLHLALYNENPEEKDTIVDLLYESVKNEDNLVYIMDVFGLNYVHVAVTRNELKMVHHFLNAGEDIEHEVLFNSRQFAHYRPLHFAIRYKRLEMTKMLIERGANIKAISIDGLPIHIAVESGEVEMIEVILQKKSKVTIARTIDGKTVMHMLVEVCMNKNGNVKKKLLRYIEKFVRLGCDVNHQDDNGDTALHLACKKISVSGIDCIRLLLNFGASINIENSDRETPFECAFHDRYKQNGESYMLLYHHVQKMKTVGFHMNGKNENCCQKILDECHQCNRDAECFQLTELDRMKESRREEVRGMMTTKLTTAMSLHKFLALSKMDAATYVKNEKLKEIIKMEDFDKKYPIYGYLIKLQFMRGQRYIKNRRKNSKIEVDEVYGEDEDEERPSKRMKLNV